MVKTDRSIWKFSIFFLVVMVWLISCERKEPPTGIKEGMREVPLTNLAMDIILPVAEMEVGLNQSLSKELLNGAIQLNGRKDSLFLHVERTRGISLAFREGQLYVAAPIKVIAVMKKKVLGMVISNKDQPVVFTATARMSSDIALDEQWGLEFDCNWEGLLWESPPVLDVMGLRVNLTEMLEREIEKTKYILESRICQAFNEKIGVREKIERAYRKIHSPITLLKDIYPVNLYLDVNDITASLGKYKMDTIILRIASKMKVGITSDAKSEENGKQLPLRRETNAHKSGMDGYLEVIVSFDYLNQLAIAHVKGHTFDYKSITVEVVGARFFNDDGFIACEVSIGGSQQAKIICRGIPTIDEKSDFYLDQFSYSLVEGDNLMEVSDATMHDAFERYLEGLFVLPLADHLHHVGALIHRGVEQTPFGKKADLDLSVWDVGLYDTGITDRQVQLIFDIKGDVQVLLEDQLFMN